MKRAMFILIIGAAVAGIAAFAASPPRQPGAKSSPDQAPERRAAN